MAKSTSPKNKEILISLYKAMLKIRRAEEKVAELYPSDKIQSPIHLCIGQEAISAGVCLAMKQSDHLYGTYRGHGVYLAKGGSMKQMFAELYAKDTGCAGGRGGSMHLIAPEVGLMGCSAIVASTIPLAVGDALATKMRKKNDVTVTFFGDGAIGEGVFFESLNFAALKKLPVVFVCENNNYAVHSRVSDRHKQTDLYKYAQPFGVPSKRLDGNDALLVYESMSDAIAKARKGSGPIFIEYMTYRIYEHVGPSKDHKEVYRETKKLKNAEKNDPVIRLGKELRQKYKIPESVFAEWESELQKEVESAVQFAEKSPEPPASRLYEHIYLERS